MATKMTREQFQKIVAENQEIQKRNPFGSAAHKAAYEAFKGIDIGEYY